MIDWLWTLYDYSDGSGIQNLISGIPKNGFDASDQGFYF